MNNYYENEHGERIDLDNLQYVPYGFWQDYTSCLKSAGRSSPRSKVCLGILPLGDGTCNDLEEDLE